MSSKNEKYKASKFEKAYPFLNLINLYFYPI